MDEWLTIEQCAELLKVSKDTIRRRIKTGEIDAEKKIGDYGLQWMIDADKINKSMQSIEVVPITRSVSVAELEQAMARTIASAVSNAVSNAVKAEVEPLRAEVQALNDKLDKQDEALKNHYQLVDERLRALHDVKQNERSWWQRFLSRP